MITINEVNRHQTRLNKPSVGDREGPKSTARIFGVHLCGLEEGSLIAPCRLRCSEWLS